VSVFVDTSALYAFLVESEGAHPEVVRAVSQVLQEGRRLRTSSYALVETSALLQRRIGLPAVRDLQARLAPLLSVAWVDRALHERAVRRLFQADRRSLSLVDCVSFELMSAEGIRDALTLDRHFTEAGFRAMPG
jgi:predicted nucleic acid-binding protein